MIIQRIFFSILLCIIGFSAFANTAAENLSTLLLQDKSLSGNFTQTNYDNNGTVLRQTHGKMALLRPGFFRWETLSPTKQIILTDPKNVWVYDVDLEQVTIQPLKQMVGQAPASLLTDSTAAILNDFTVTEEGDVAKNIWFTLTPHDQKSLYQKIQLHFSHQQLDKMDVVDNIGQKTAVTFQDLKINPSLSRDTFRAKIPKNVDVIGRAL